jgi:hypothetical protein
MKDQTLKRMQHFVGKVCSLYTATDRVLSMVEYIDVDGIWGSDPEHKTLNFWPLGHIIQIAEELVLDPQNPEHAKIIQEHTSQQKAPSVEPEPAPKEGAAFVDIQNIKKLAQQTKAIYNSKV